MVQKNIKTIHCNVYNGTTLVGVLTRVPGDNSTTIFDYSPDYQGPPLSMALPKGVSTRTEGLQPFFCNLISEGWLEEAQKRILEARQNGDDLTEPTRFDILAYFGRDCIGSIRVEPQEQLPLGVVRVIEDIGTKLAARNNALVPGVQPKFLAIKKPDGDFSIAAPTDRSTHIAKIEHDNPELPYILHNELASTEIFRALLPHDQTSNVELLKFPACLGGEALLIERFDRTPDGIPVEFYEFSQLLNKDTDDKYNGSYKDIANFIRSHAPGKSANGIKTSLDDIEVLFKRILGTILVENGDAHLKNFALLRKGDEFRLSPNYDIVSCSRYKGYGEMALAIGATRDIPIASMQPKHIVALAKDFGLLSEKPTQEEVANVSRLINEVGTQVKAVKAALEGKSDMDQFPRLKKILDTPYLRSETTGIFKAVEKRWNGTLAGTEFFMHKKLALSTQSPQVPAPRTPSCPTPRNVLGG